MVSVIEATSNSPQSNDPDGLINPGCCFDY